MSEKCKCKKPDPDCPSCMFPEAEAKPRRILKLTLVKKWSSVISCIDLFKPRKI